MLERVMTSSTDPKPASAKRGSKSGVRVVSHSLRSGPFEVELAGRLATAVLDLTLEMPKTDRRRLAESPRFKKLVVDAVVDALSPSVAAHHRANRLDGDGLGDLLPVGDGLKALGPSVENQRIEQWAGPVAGATALHRNLGIARSTLQEWRQQKAVIGLLKGLKKEVFPLAQFVDGRPVQGLAAIREAIPQPRVAWLWLTTPHPELGDATPLSRLRSTRSKEAIDLAKADYGQP